VVSDRAAHEAVAFVDASDRVLLLMVLAAGDEKDLAATTPSLMGLARSARRVVER
jgi:hypothetical protein